MQNIGHFSLRNQGGFVVKLQFVYWDDNGDKIHCDGTGSYPIGQTQSDDPGDHGVPDGAMVALYTFVVWGIDNEANQIFTYKKGSAVTAYYAISGTTLNSQLALIKVE